MSTHIERRVTASEREFLHCTNCDSFSSVRYLEETTGVAAFLDAHRDCIVRVPFESLFDLVGDLSFDYYAYRTSEREIIDPALVAAGYELVGEWHTGDGDSFGPLTRWRRVRKDGSEVKCIYG